MSRPIVHKNLFALLALELGGTAQELSTAVARDVTQLFAVEERLAKAGFQDLGLTLAEPVVDGRDGAVLLAAQVRLTPRYVKLLLTRQLQDEGATIGPIALVADDGALRHYRAKVRRQLESLVQGVRESAHRETRLIHEAIRSSEDLKGIEAIFGQLVEGLLADGEALGVLLATLGSKGTSGIFERSIDASFVAMAVRVRYGDLAAHDRARDEVADVGLAALLQDLSSAADPDTDAGSHTERSAEFAGRLGVSTAVQEIIRGHHRMGAAQGLPAPLPGRGASTGQRVLVTVNVFLAMMGGEVAGKSFETMKTLSHLADAGVVDARSVLTICRMFLPRLKAYIMEQAGRIGRRCALPGGRPILWPITGDKVPTLYLCRHETCPNRTDQVTRLAHAVPFCVNGAQVATIDRGDYFTCPPLTRDLRRLYEVVQAHIKKGA